ncbi:MAG: hypothetical protein NXI01_00550 [Gammaproteobacteria bacterium]|nr:hypothetical protein [Gammaproteobacteria bacterium]
MKSKKEAQNNSDLIPLLDYLHELSISKSEITNQDQEIYDVAASISPVFLYIAKSDDYSSNDEWDLSYLSSDKGEELRQLYFKHKNHIDSYAPPTSPYPSPDRSESSSEGLTSLEDNALSDDSQQGDPEEKQKLSHFLKQLHHYQKMNIPKANGYELNMLVDTVKTKYPNFYKLVTMKHQTPHGLDNLSKKNKTALLKHMNDFRHELESCLYGLAASLQFRNTHGMLNNKDNALLNGFIQCGIGQDVVDNLIGPYPLEISTTAAIDDDSNSNTTTSTLSEGLSTNTSYDSHYSTADSLNYSSDEEDLELPTIKQAPPPPKPKTSKDSKIDKSGFLPAIKSTNSMNTGSQTKKMKASLKKNKGEKSKRSDDDSGDAPKTFS